MCFVAKTREHTFFDSLFGCSLVPRDLYFTMFLEDLQVTRIAVTSSVSICVIIVIVKMNVSKLGAKSAVFCRSNSTFYKVRFCVPKKPKMTQTMSTRQEDNLINQKYDATVLKNAFMDFGALEVANYIKQLPRYKINKGLNHIIEMEGQNRI